MQHFGSGEEKRTTRFVVLVTPLPIAGYHRRAGTLTRSSCHLSPSTFAKVARGQTAAVEIIPNKSSARDLAQDTSRKRSRQPLRTLVTAHAFALWLARKEPIASRTSGLMIGMQGPCHGIKDHSLVRHHFRISTFRPAPSRVSYRLVHSSPPTPIQKSATHLPAPF